MLEGKRLVGEDCLQRRLIDSIAPKDRLIEKAIGFTHSKVPKLKDRRTYGALKGGLFEKQLQLFRSEDASHSLQMAASAKL